MTVSQEFKFKGDLTKKFFSRGYLIDIIRIEHEKGIGYHFRASKPSNKGESYYSIPLITQEEAEKAAMIFVKNGKL